MQNSLNRIGRSVSGLRKEVVQTAGTLHHPDHLDTVWDDAVEDLESGEL